MSAERSRGQTLAAVTAFVSLFAIVGLALYGLPFFYDFMVKEFGWTRAQVTSGNAYSKLIVGPLFGFFAGWFVDRFGSRRLMIVGILLAGLAPIGLGMATSLAMFYTFYLCNALGYVCGGPLPNQVLLSKWFDAGRGRAMGFAYLGIGVGGALVPLIAHALTTRYGWQTALQLLGVLMIAMALPLILLVKDRPVAADAPARPLGGHRRPRARRRAPRSAPAARGRASGPTGRSRCSSSAACARSARSAGRCRT